MLEAYRDLVINAVTFVTVIITCVVLVIIIVNAFSDDKR